ncbi:MAG: hypothetical protein JWO57_1000, partial [Pseudonocardiales bacterium]|nr:hypothetical protein [Pseudonocardiales bacterium]
MQQRGGPADQIVLDLGGADLVIHEGNEWYRSGTTSHSILVAG